MTIRPDMTPPRAVHSNGARRMLVSDLDGTLLGDDEALARFANWRATQGASFALVYATGRTFESVREAVASTSLPPPAAVIGAVGAEIRAFPDGAPLLDWPRARPPEWCSRTVREALDGHGRLALQPTIHLNDHKVSYYLHDASEVELRDIETRLARTRLCYGLLYSADKFLDVLPAGVDKGAAVTALANHWACDLREAIVCGDTGNDVAMFQLGCRGVVVGNAHEELRRRSGADSYQARAHFADGVLEGLAHWGVRSEE